MKAALSLILTKMAKKKQVFDDSNNFMFAKALNDYINERNKLVDRANLNTALSMLGGSAIGAGAGGFLGNWLLQKLTGGTDSGFGAAAGLGLGTLIGGIGGSEAAYRYYNKKINQPMDLEYTNYMLGN